MYSEAGPFVALQDPEDQKLALGGHSIADGMPSN